MREMVENCGKWWKMGPMLKIGGKWCMEHGPNGVWNMDQNGGKLGPNGVWNMVQNGGKLWKMVGMGGKFMGNDTKCLPDDASFFVL